MRAIDLGKTKKKVSATVVGCMRIGDLTTKEVNTWMEAAMEKGVSYFDHADIYGRGKSEEVFGKACKENAAIKREDLFLQSKCGIVPGSHYDLSKEYIMQAVEGSLKRLQTDYLDMLLLHRPDALVEPEEVAEAFDLLSQSGKVRYFGVSNHNPMQIQLLKRYVKQEIQVNQMQFSIPVSNMVAAGIEVNMDTPGSFDHDGSVLDYCRLNDITIQAWSPFQMPNWQGLFLGNESYGPLNKEIDCLAEKYGVSQTAIAAAWIYRHPAKMQLITGTGNPKRLTEIIEASEIRLTREEWYRLYLAAGHILP